MTSKCPECGGTDVRRSHSQGSEKIARYLFARKHFRCRECNARWAAVAFEMEDDYLMIFLWAGILLAVCFFVMYFSGQIT